MPWLLICSTSGRICCLIVGGCFFSLWWLCTLASFLSFFLIVAILSLATLFFFLSHILFLIYWAFMGKKMTTFCTPFSSYHLKFLYLTVGYIISQLANVLLLCLLNGFRKRNGITWGTFWILQGQWVLPIFWCYQKLTLRLISEWQGLLKVRLLHLKYTSIQQQQM